MYKMYKIKGNQEAVGEISMAKAHVKKKKTRKCASRFESVGNFAKQENLQLAFASSLLLALEGETLAFSLRRRIFFYATAFLLLELF